MQRVRQCSGTPTDLQRFATALRNLCQNGRSTLIDKRYKLFF